MDSDEKAETKYKPLKNEDDTDSGGSEYFTVQEAIEKIGFGKFQILITLGAGFQWLADGMEIMTLAILGPVLECEWDISETQSAAITTVVFTGVLVANPTFGWLADVYGRVAALFWSSVVVTIFGIAVAFSPNYETLLVLRFCVGCGIGGGVQAITYNSEFLPVDRRGILLVLTMLYFSIGAMMTCLLAIIVLVPVDWRWWLGLSVFPTLIFLGICAFLPSSPQYDLARGEKEKAMETLKMMARVNKTEVPSGTLVMGPQVERGKFQDLFVPSLRLTTVLLSYIWIAAPFGYYGAVLFTTELVDWGETCPPDDFVNGTWPYIEEEDDPCDDVTTETYAELLLIATAELPGLALTVFMIDPVGRKNTMIAEFLIFAGMCGLLCFCMGKGAMLILLFIARAVIGSAFQVLFVYASELYPTQIRAIAIGSGAMIGRLGAIVTPFSAQVLLDESLWLAMPLYAAVIAGAAVIAYFLPKETKGLLQSQATETSPLLGDDVT